MLNAQPRHTLATTTDSSASTGEEMSGAGPSPARDK